jgi:acetyltransferase-like isoleucine patch superfamily enzyme
MSAPGERIAKTHAAVTGDRSALARYQDVVVGHRSLLGLAYFEICLWLAFVPGALGLMLRRLFWPRLFRFCGRKVYFGSNVTLMHPGRIAISDRAVISNGCVLDARSPASEVAITIGSDVMLSQGVMLSCKNAGITLGDRVGMGPYTVVQAVNDDPVLIDDDAVIAAHCYIAGGGQYRMDRLDLPIARQPMKRTGETRIGAGVWLGAHVTVLGGVTVSRDSVVGAGSVVTRSLPEMAICIGTPARVVRRRDEPEGEAREAAASRPEGRSPSPHG